MLNHSEDNIKYEIMTNGPVEAGFTVYEDFPLYKSGVYQYTHGKELAGHAVRIIDGAWRTVSSTGW